MWVAVWTESILGHFGEVDFMWGGSVDGVCIGHTGEVDFMWGGVWTESVLGCAGEADFCLVL